MKYTWRYGIINEVSEVENNIVGVGTTEIVHSEADSVYVSADTGSDTTGDGSYAMPYATIQKAIDNIGSKVKVTIIDNAIYYANEVAGNYITLDGIILQADIGKQPTLTIDTGKAYNDRLVYIINGGTIINFILQGIEAVEDITGIVLDYGTVKNCEIKNMTYCGIDIYDGYVQNTIVHDISGLNETYGIKINGVTGSDIIIQECLLYNCGMYGIYCNATSPTINHCTITDNLNGIVAINNSLIELNNNIIYNNRLYDVDCQNGIYGINCIRKTKYKIIETTIRSNPLFGDDYKLMYTVGTPKTIGIISPCIAMADDGKDLGCYNTTRIINSIVTGSFETERPLIRKQRKEPINANKYTTYNLKKVNYADGFIEILYLAWPDNYVLTVGEIENLITMYETDGYVQLDEGDSYETYIIDKSNQFQWSKSLNIKDNTYYMNIELELIKV